jgi:hypothetical protein
MSPHRPAHPQGNAWGTVAMATGCFGLGSGAMVAGLLAASPDAFRAHTAERPQPASAVAAPRADSLTLRRQPDPPATAGVTGITDGAAAQRTTTAAGSRDRATAQVAVPAPRYRFAAGGSARTATRTPRSTTMPATAAKVPTSRPGAKVLTSRPAAKVTPKPVTPRPVTQTPPRTVVAPPPVSTSGS